MSLLSQFFPSGGGGVGGGTIPVEILGVSGGGGGGASGSFAISPYSISNCPGGSGGMGAFFYADNYFLTPGATYPICVGSGGAGGTGSFCCKTQGSNGGFTSFNNPVCPLRVEGGGGGGAGGLNCPTYPQPCLLSHGLNGGTGGGANGQGGSGGCGLYHMAETSTAASNLTNVYTTFSPGFGPPTPLYAFPFQMGTAITNTTLGELKPTPWGIMGGFPGSNGYSYNPQPTCPSNIQYYGGAGGGMTANRTMATCISPGPTPCSLNYAQCIVCQPRGFNSSITGVMVSYGSTSGAPGQGAPAPGAPNSALPGCSGCPGVLIIRWPSCSAGAAPPTGFPGATNISPSTPGYYTYCFTSSGSITLP